MHDHDDLQVFRQWMILRASARADLECRFANRPKTAGVDRQTIRRDLKLLQNLGFPLVESTGPRGRKTEATRPCTCAGRFGSSK